MKNSKSEKAKTREKKNIKKKKRNKGYQERRGKRQGEIDKN